MKKLKNLKITKKGKKEIWENKAYSFEEADEFNIQFWKNVDPQEKFAAAWQMIQDFYKIRGQNVPELRLRRSVQNIEQAPD